MDVYCMIAMNGIAFIALISVLLSFKWHLFHYAVAPLFSCGFALFLYLAEEIEKRGNVPEDPFIGP